MAIASPRRYWHRPLRSPLRGVPPVGTFAALAALLCVGLVLPMAALPGVGAGEALLASLCLAAGAGLAARAMHKSYPHDRLGLCNAVTLTRLALTMALVAPLVAGIGASWIVFGMASVALALDGVDGYLARRQGNASDFGARFDMEVDSALALVLALNAAASGAGPAAILLGLPRYLFLVALWALPWMRRDVPPRFSRKVVCVLQLAALIALQAPVVPDAVALALVPVVAALLAWSFALDVVWLWRRRR